MTVADERFRRLLQEARDDPAILGLVLTGSRGKGFGTEASDYDVLVVVRDMDLGPFRMRYGEEMPPGIDWRATTLDEFEAYASWGSASAWDRYSFAHAAVLVDKTGRIRRMVDEKGSVPEEHRRPIVRSALDAYINGVYRSLKCLRNRNQLGALLEAADSIGHALTVIFALEGRLRPYHGYLERELRAYPLNAFPLSPDDLLAALELIVGRGEAGAQQRLLGVVEGVTRAAGHGDVIDAWGSDYEWMTHVRLPELT